MDPVNPDGILNPNIRVIQVPGGYITEASYVDEHEQEWTRTAVFTSLEGVFSQQVDYFETIEPLPGEDEDGDVPVATPSPNQN